MGIWGFIIWFTSGLIGTMFLQILFENEFLTSFIVACFMGFLGAMSGT